MIVHDLILATRRPALTGIERFAINVFEAARDRSDEVAALVSEGSHLSGTRNVITVGKAFGSWLAVRRHLQSLGPCRGMICAAFPASPSLLASRLPIVRVIHDAFVWTHPHNVTLQGRLMFAYWERLMMRRYRHIFAPTTVARDELARTLPGVRIEVCGNAPGLKIVEGSLSPVPAIADRRFILAVGTIEPRKNYERLITLDRHMPGIDMIVVAGRAGWGDISARLGEAAQRPNSHLLWLDDVNDAELRWLYSRCALFMTLSHAEGFNMPLVEAGMSGCAIVCSDLPIHRVVAPPWARFVAADASDETMRAAAATAQSAERVGLADYRRRFDWQTISAQIEAPLRDPARPVSVAS